MNKYNLVKLNTARNCLRYVIRAFSIKKIYIPYYLCPAIRNSILKENCKIVFYHIDKKFRPVQDFSKDAFILYPNYFGICSHIVDELSLEYKNLIVDNAHSFYSEPKGIASFNSLRKFFPTVLDGAFLYTTKIIDEQFQIDENNYAKKNLSYREVCENEQRLDFEDIKYINPISENYIEDKEKRIEKINYWKNKLNSTNMLEVQINANDLPFCYPYLAKDEKTANELVKILEIEPFRYWHNLPDDFEEKIFYTNLVAISI